MRIKHTSQFLPFYESKNELTFDEEVFLALLEEDKEFETAVIKIRQRYGIPLSGWTERNIRNINGNYSLALEKVFKGKLIVFNKEISNPKIYAHIGIKDDLGLFYDDAKGICYKYDLPYYWISTVACFVAFNVLPIPSKLSPIAFYKKDDPHRIFAESSENILITIEQRVSKDQLKKWLEENWKGIKRELERLPKHPEQKLPLIKLYKRIAYWDKRVKKSQKIADELLNENANWDFDYDRINILRDRLRKAIKKLRPQRNPLNLR